MNRAQLILVISVIIAILGAICIDCKIILTGWTLFMIGVGGIFLCKEIDNL